MSLVSIKYIGFVLIIILLYYMLPQKLRKYVIFGGNIFFYYLVGIKKLILLTAIIVMSYFIAKLFSKKKKKYLLIGGIVASLTPLLVFKYSNFEIYILNTLIEKFSLGLALPTFKYVEPLGLSFFTFKVISYLVDVYYGRVLVEHRLIDYANYVSFFPTIVSGPIDRANDFFEELNKPVVWDCGRVKEGVLICLYGYFQKIVIADRLNYIVNTTFNDYQLYSGFVLLITSFFYSIQIYLDFAGYTYIVKGIAYAMGIRISDNFKQPYFSANIREFWQRWHISLSSWLRDYVYIPLGGNRKGHLRKYLNLLITFLISGLWHGAGWNYIVWGGLHGIFQICEDIVRNLIQKITQKNEKSENCFLHILKVIWTFLLVNFAWIIFWSDGSLVTAMNIIVSMREKGNASFQWICDIGISNIECATLAIGIICIFVIDYLKYNKINVMNIFFKQCMVIRYIILYVLIFGIILFGYYGPSYNASNFIYCQF